MTEPLERQPGESLLEFARRNALAKGYVKPTQTPQNTKLWDDDLIPDATSDLDPALEQERLEIDSILGKVDIIEAYNRWCGKMVPDPGGKRESIMISCPDPAHPDKTPSAWINLDKGDGGVWHCGGCNTGGDKYDIAAWHFGYHVPDYKIHFPELRRKMAEDLGYQVMVQGKDQWLVPTHQPLAVGTGTADEEHPSIELVAPVPTTLDPFKVLDAPPVINPTFDWRELQLEPETFLHSWLQLTSQSFEPEEFYMWQGLMALASAVGNKVIYDDTIPVRPNLMVCLIGSTGTGKSIAISVFEKLLREALPWQPTSGGGVRMVSSPGSGEALLDQFVHEINDPTAGTRQHFPVNGLYRESELAAFAKRTSRAGNTMREIVMDLYDRPLPVTSTSRGAGSVTAREHFMQMVTSTQPDSVSRLLTDADAAAGFLNRWVFAFGQAKIRPPRNALRIDVQPCIDLLRNVRAWAGVGREVRFDDNTPAADAWDTFYLSEIHPLTMEDDAWMAARLPLLAKKLVLLLAVNDHRTIIELEHVQALKKMWPYLLQCYEVVGASVGINELEKCANRIEAYLRERPGESFTFREISKQSGAKKFSREEVLKALDLLIRGSIVGEVARRQGDRVIRYQHVAPAGTTI